jgi:hypothetical protein
MSERWRAGAAQANVGFGGVRWETTVEVPVVTLDDLIAAYGVPSFCKIDVEGYEAEVLEGLSRPIAGLSVEFVAGQLDVAAACVRRLQELGSYRFNAVLGERRDFAHAVWLEAEELLAWLEAGAGDASSGDIYAWMGAPRPTARRAPGPTPGHA